MIITYADTYTFLITAAAPTHSVLFVEPSTCRCSKFPHIYQHILCSLTLTCFLPSPTFSEVKHPPPIHHQTVTSSATNLLHLLSNPSKPLPSRNSSLRRNHRNDFINMIVITESHVRMSKCFVCEAEAPFTPGIKMQSVCRQGNNINANNLLSDRSVSGYSILSPEDTNM